jgi:hypothetical protein
MAYSILTRATRVKISTSTRQLRFLVEPGAGRPAPESVTKVPDYPPFPCVVGSSYAATSTHEKLVYANTTTLDVANVRQLSSDEASKTHSSSSNTIAARIDVRISTTSEIQPSLPTAPHSKASARAAAASVPSAKTNPAVMKASAETHRLRLARPPAVVETRSRTGTEGSASGRWPLSTSNTRVQDGQKQHSPP